MARLKSEVVMFDEEEYAELMRHYLEPVVNEENENATRPRRQSSGAFRLVFAKLLTWYSGGARRWRTTRPTATTRGRFR